MAVMSRAKQAKGRGWAQKNEERRAGSEKDQSEEGKQITEEEHNKRMKLLKGMGLIKEDSE